MVRTGYEPQEALMLLVPEAYRWAASLSALLDPHACARMPLPLLAPRMQGTSHRLDTPNTPLTPPLTPTLTPPPPPNPPPPRNHPDLMKGYPEVVDFYEYWEGLQEGWDGPALLVFSDGKKIGARLDRNGLRPARFWRTADDTIYVASEVGVLGDVLTNAGNVVAKGRLGPGQTVCADLETGKFAQNAEVSKAAAARFPYKKWVASSVRRLEQLSDGKFRSEPAMEAAQMLRLQVRARAGLICCWCVC
jgi:hypothetical protein